MRISKLPAEALDRFDAITRHAEMLARAAMQADARLAANRETQRGNFNKTGRMRDDCATMERAKQEFVGILESSQEARKRADQARRVAASVKAFVDQLPDVAEIELAAAPKANGVDLAEVRSRIAKLRSEIARLRGAPAAADRGRIGAWIDENLRDAEAHIAQLAGRHPHFLDTAAEHDIMTDLLKLVLRDALAGELVSRIDARADVTAPERLAALESELAALQQLEVMFVGRAIESGATDIVHDPATAPATILGVRLVGTNAEAREIRELVS